MLLVPSKIGEGQALPKDSVGILATGLIVAAPCCEKVNQQRDELSE
jgi:hypothetical protein